MDINAAMNEMIATLEAMDPDILEGGIVFWASVLTAIFAAAVIIGVTRYLMKGILEEEMATHSNLLAWRIPRKRSLVG